jgi:hypothetical protein
MTPFQIVGLSLLALLALATCLGLMRGRQRWSSLAWLVVWVGAGVALYRPNLTRDAARLVGIDRGADLVSYLTTLLLLVVIFLMTIRMRRFEGYVTQLTRELALTRAELSQTIEVRRQPHS